MARTPKSTVREIQSIDDLSPDPENANNGTARGRRLLAASIKELGAGRSVVAEASGTVLAGNKTVETARALGIPVRVVQTTGEELVVVQRTDLYLEDPEARALALADNRIAELDLDWNAERVRAQLETATPLAGLWSRRELEALVGEGLHRGRHDENSVVPMRETSIVVGDLFELGSHRLLCGDATSATDVARLCGDHRAPLLATDPPYGVGYDAAWRVRAGGEGRHAVGDVLNDDRVDWREAFVLFEGHVLYAWHAGLHAATAAAAIRSCGFTIRSQIIWVKPALVLGRGDFHWQHEPCWYAVREGQPSGFRGDRTHSTVWEVPNLNPISGERGGENERTGHSTQKPVRLFELPILHHTDEGDWVYDPFVGSGTALIAAEKTGRRCLAMELSPVYVQAVIDRWEAFSGQTATKVGEARR